MLIPLLWLSFNCRIIKTHNHDWDVVSRSSHHWFKKQSLWALSIPLFFLKSRFINFFYHLYCLVVLDLVPKTVASNNKEIVTISFKACYFRFAYHYLRAWLFCLKIAECSCCWQPSWENSQWSYNLIEVFSLCLCDGCSLINLSSGWNYSLLFIRIWRFMIFTDLIKLFTVLTRENSSWIS